jgi:hypothetical protein
MRINEHFKKGGQGFKIPRVSPDLLTSKALNLWQFAELL